MADTVLRTEKPGTIDYTPSSNVALGQVVVLSATGLTLGIAQTAIPANTLGALAVAGVYQVTAAGNYAAYSKLYWDDTAKKVTTTSTNNYLFGMMSERNGTGDITNKPIEAICHPFA